MDQSILKKTALNEVHHQLGARMIDFGGWEMPVQYSGTIEEHLAVRNAAGLFDVSHMGELEVKGAHALDLVQLVTTNDASKLADGQIQYAPLTTPQGTFIDDLLVHRIHAEHFFLCVNASNADKDFAWIQSHAAGMDVEVINACDRYAQIAIQGPNALSILQQLTETSLESIRYYWFQHGKVAGVDAMIARTGYTGEDGFEIYFDPSEAGAIWNQLLAIGGGQGLIPCGLAARNTLRLEAKMALYGNDIDETTSVYEADLGWTVKVNKGDFIGRDALLQQKEQGISRKLVGFEMVERGIGRDHYPVYVDGSQFGQVCSGSPAPFLKKNIGLVYLPIARTEIGSRFEIEIRGKLVGAQVTATPFYKRVK